MSKDFIVERQWTTGAGLPAYCLIILFDGRKSHRCGYVGVPDGHPLFGKDYDAASESASVEVHGGLTYASQGDGDPFDAAMWWFGFNCANAGDGDIEPSRLGRDRGPAKSLDYVSGQCEALAAQMLAARTPGATP